MGSAKSITARTRSRTMSYFLLAAASTDARRSQGRHHRHFAEYRFPLSEKLLCLTPLIFNQCTTRWQTRLYRPVRALASVNSRLVPFTYGDNNIDAATPVSYEGRRYKNFRQQA